MSSTYSVRLSFGYDNTDYERQYRFDGVSSTALGDVKDNVIAINDSIAASTDGGFSDFFVSEDGQKTFGIVEAKIINVEEIPVEITGGE